MQTLLEMKNAQLALAFLCSCLASAIGVAQEVERVYFPVASDYVLVSYTVQHDMLPEADPQPLLTIYSNGRVHVHRPSYFKSPGDYELWLSPGELQSLCKQMIKPVMLFSEQLATAEITEDPSYAGKDFAISDNSQIALSLNVHAVKIAGVQSIATVATKNLAIKNLSARAKVFPKAKSIGNLAGIEKILRKIVFSQDLTRLQ